MARVKPKVMIFTEAYEPGFRAGGPIQSLRNLVAALQDEFDFLIVTSSWDLGADGPYEGVIEDRWNERSGARVRYVSPGLRGLVGLTRAVLGENPDVLYFNGMFHFRLSIWPLLLARLRHRGRLVVSPRGMLGPGALQSRRLKKQLFLTLARGLGLYRGLEWHATSELEAGEVRDFVGPGVRVRVAPNLVTQGASTARRPTKQPGRALFCFLSRVSEKKNLEFLFAVLQRIGGSPEVEFRIYGPADSPAYLAKLQALVPPLWRDRVHFQGPVPHAQVGATIGSHHFMVLPTRHENFGHAIVESLIQGTPVLISECTPWRQLEAARAGWDLPFDEARWEGVLRRCIDMSSEEHAELSKGAVRYGRGIVEDPDGLRSTREVLWPPPGWIS